MMSSYYCTSLPHRLYSELQSQYDDAKANNKAKITFYGEKKANDKVKTVDNVMLQREKSGHAYITYVDKNNRPRLFRNAEDEFQMFVSYGQRDSAQFTLEMNGKYYNAGINLDDIVDGDGRRRMKSTRGEIEVFSNVGTQGQHFITVPTTEANQEIRNETEQLPKDPSSLTVTNQEQQGHRRLKRTSRTVKVEVKGCNDESYDDAVLLLDYLVKPVSGSQRKRGTAMGASMEDGWYEFHVPVNNENNDNDDGIPENLKDICRPVVSFLDGACKKFDETLGLSKKAKRKRLCDAIIDDLGLNKNNKGDKKLMDELNAACKNSLNAAYLSCAVLEPINDNDDTFICNNGLVNDAGNKFIGDWWRLTPKFVYPFNFATSEDIGTDKGDVPKKNIVHKLQTSPYELGNTPTILSFTSSAKNENPKLGKGCTLTAEVSCVKQSKGDQVMITRVGSDNYKDVKICKIPNSNTKKCTCDVPAAEMDGCQDTCTVWITRDNGKTVSRTMTVVHGKE